MKDSLGNNLAVGDIVIVIKTWWDSKVGLMTGRVTGFTPKRIRVVQDITKCTGGRLHIAEHVAKRYPESL